MKIIDFAVKTAHCLSDYFLSRQHSVDTAANLPLKGDRRFHITAKIEPLQIGHMFHNIELAQRLEARCQFSLEGAQRRTSLLI